MSGIIRKWALITNVSPGGMGEAQVVAFRRRGINVIATSVAARNVGYSEPEAGSNEGFLVTLSLDVTVQDSISAAARQVDRLTDGKLQYLLNGAECNYLMPLMDTEIGQAKKQYEVTVWGFLSVVQAFFPLLRAAKGTVIVQTSIAGFQNFNQPFMGIYSSSKAALISLGATLRVELAPFDIRVATLVTTDFQTEPRQSRKRVLVARSSAYFPIKAEVEAAMNDAVAHEDGSDRLNVANDSVAGLLESAAPAVIWGGRFVGLLSLFYWLVPTSFLDSQAAKSSGLQRLRKILLDEQGDSISAQQ